MTKAVIEPAVPAGKSKGLLDQMRDVLRLKHYSVHPALNIDRPLRLGRVANYRVPVPRGCVERN
jgi:hypothetical protein